MRLAIISEDEIQLDVLRGAARRRGWEVLPQSSAALAAEAAPDAVIVDVGCVNGRVSDDLALLAGRIGLERVFLLVEREEAARRAVGALHARALHLKPVHPASLLQALEVSVRAR